MSCLSFAVLFSSENSFRLDQMDLKIWSFTIYITSLTFSLWLFWTVLKIASTRGSSRSVEQHVKAYPSAPRPRAKHNTPLRELVSRARVLALSSQRSDMLASASLWTSCELSVSPQRAIQCCVYCQWTGTDVWFCW